jgi:FKBP-type peptidyl-prolyl cis-trans isomerase FklB
LSCLQVFLQNMISTVLRAAFALSSLQLSFAGTNEFGKKFLEENAQKEGVITLPSGLQYKVIRTGSGTDHPTKDSPCDCHYEGRTAQQYPDGDKFDSSYDRGSPTSFAPNQVIKGWTEAMQLMVEGDKWEMYIPSELGYGDSGSPPKIGGGDVLVFTMEIIKIKGKKVPANRCDVKTLSGCSDKQKEYLEKQKSKGKDAVQAELARLKNMKSGTMKEDKLDWLNVRVGLLEKLQLEL